MPATAATKALSEFKHKNKWSMQTGKLVRNVEPFHSSEFRRLLADVQREMKGAASESAMICGSHCHAHCKQHAEK